MKHIIKSIGLAFLAGLAFAACSPEEYEGADPNGVPTIADAKYSVTVDQAANVVTFTLNNPGYYPIWDVEGTPPEKTTVNGFQKKYMFKGTYKFKLKIGNRNGVSDGEIVDSFTVDTTRYDFSKTIKALTDDDSKEWRVYATKKGHMGVGPAGSDGTEWWSAGPNEKAGEGIYDDVITFSADKKYKYDAGADGLTFCNQGVTTLGVTGAGGDYSIPLVGQFDTQTEATYSLGYDEANDVETITLPAKTLFPYIGADYQMQSAYTFRILSIDSKYMELVLDLPDISWHFSFINGEDPAPSTDFDPNKVNWADVNSDLNLAKNLNTVGQMVFWWSDPNWAQIGDPGFSYADGVYTITANSSTAAQWQAQCSIHDGNVQLQAGEAYDVSVTINASEAFENATIKLCDDVDGDNPTLIYENPVSLKRGDNVLRWAKRYPQTKGADASATNMKFIIDLGGCPAGLITKVSNIIVQKHNPK